MRNSLLGLALLAILSNVVILILIMAALDRLGHKTNMLPAEKGGCPRNEEGGQEADQFRWSWASRFYAPGEGFSMREERLS